MQQSTGSVTAAWALVFTLLAIGFVVIAVYHWIVLPRPVPDVPATRGHALLSDFVEVLAAFFRKPGIGVTLAFLLLYRFPEAQLLKLATPFLLDAPAAGGLGLSTEQVGIVYGTIGLIALTLGGILGGWAISRLGLKRLLWPLAITMHLPNLVFVVLAAAQPHSTWLVAAALAVEQFGYGCGFTAYMLYMIMVSDGPHKTAHYAICTGFMALGMMLPGMASGWLQSHLGYLAFFVWVCVAALPSFVMVALIKVEPAFGRKARAAA